VISYPRSVFPTANTSPISITHCGDYVASASGNSTFKIQLATASGTAYLGTYNGDGAIQWTVKAIDGGSDEEDAEQLYTLLEQQVVPQFHTRDAWLELMKSSIAELAPRFSMQRTVIEYADRYYVPAARASVS